MPAEANLTQYFVNKSFGTTKVVCGKCGLNIRSLLVEAKCDNVSLEGVRVLEIRPNSIVSMAAFPSRCPAQAGDHAAYSHHYVALHKGQVLDFFLANRENPRAPLVLPFTAYLKEMFLHRILDKKDIRHVPDLKRFAETHLVREFTTSEVLSGRLPDREFKTIAQYLQRN